jgi:hypothetical protein
MSHPNVRYTTDNGDSQRCELSSDSSSTAVMLEVNDTMKRISLISCIILLISSSAYAQSDDEILEKVRANGVEIYLEQASWTLPESFHNSGLAETDKERLIEQWANASAACMTDALAKYAESSDVPLLEMVNDDGSFSLKGDGSLSEFNLTVETCIERAWQAVGASLP